ncbi:MAG: EamA family transporter RarD [SAR324 cluster bacterium]|nr:EamA family transporter RarD [SAR324 cluster bacterium]
MNFIGRGTASILTTYLLWGILPVFWKSIAKVPALEILSHRMLWFLLFLLVLLVWQKKWKWLSVAKENPKTLLPSLCCSVLLGINWYTFIWAVNSGFIVESSLGYFINPLVTILLGMLFLKEQLRPGQWLAMGISLGGIFHLTFNYGSFPWIAMILAFTFAFYALLRKTTKIGGLEGLSVEASVLFIPSLVYLVFLEQEGLATFGHVTYRTDFLLMATGIVTAVPLLFFSYGAKRVSMTMMGMLQYITPTMHFLLGVFLYKESLTLTRLIGFLAIWTALIVYSAEGYFWANKIRKQKAM